MPHTGGDAGGQQLVSPQPATADDQEPEAESVQPSEPTLARVLFEWPGGEEGDLALSKGEVVTVTSVLPGYGWWTGEVGDAAGIFPRNYVRL